MFIGLGIFVALIAIVVVIASRQPDTFRYTRAIRIEGPAEGPFNQVNNFHAWEGWSPWGKLDPAMTTTYTGPESGVGARYAWDSKSGKVGSGNMHIRTATAPRLVEVDLVFLRPFKANNLAIFTFEPAGTGTQVTWSMEGKRPLMIKIMGLLMNMEAMIGKDFEKGLAALKAQVEGKA